MVTSSHTVHSFTLTLCMEICKLHKCCKPTFIQMQEIFARFDKASLQTFLAANQPLSYGCYNNTGLNKAWSQTLVIANNFLGCKFLIKLSMIKVRLQ